MNQKRTPHQQQRKIQIRHKIKTDRKYARCHKKSIRQRRLHKICEAKSEEVREEKYPQEKVQAVSYSDFEV